jgi:molecular chaperone DnaK
VFDFGGGTFDVSILRIWKGNSEVKATSGDTHLGGQDLDTKLVEYCMDVFKEGTNIDLKLDKVAQSRLREKCKRVKEILQSETETKLTLLNLS